MDYTIGRTLIWRFNFLNEEILVKDNNTIYDLLCLSMIFVVDRDGHCFKSSSYCCQWFKSIVRTRIFKLPDINLNRTGDGLKWRLNIWYYCLETDVQKKFFVKFVSTIKICRIVFLDKYWVFVKWNHNVWNQHELYIHCRWKFYVENFVNCCTMGLCSKQNCLT